jgi:hypothetical protein
VNRIFRLYSPVPDSQGDWKMGERHWAKRHLRAGWLVFVKNVVPKLMFR